MQIRDDIRHILHEPTWRYPIATGLISIPLSLLIQWSLIDEPGLVPPLVGGIVVSVIFRHHSVPSRRLGWRAGLVASVGVVIGTLSFLLELAGGTHTLFSGGVAVFFLAFVTGLFILLYGVIGAIGGIIGEWVGRKIGRRNVESSPA
ncbi:DUF5518 domain-containing protein [Haloferax mucosum]|uniref:DUF5518 domain-containing protein n=1 Tax=Haloferax mucosum TaxID=403181 RepID=UPI001266F4A2|nr:DUF5518 domain-containing protein [Haloferax mucosum]